MSRPVKFAAIIIGAALLAPSIALADTVTITAAGSTALQPLVQAAAEAYQANNADVKISVTGGGSRTGLTLVNSKSVDIGDSDILAAKDQTDLVDHRAAAVGFAIVYASNQAFETGLANIIDALYLLEKALHETDPSTTAVIVMTAKLEIGRAHV